MAAANGRSAGVGRYQRGEVAAQNRHGASIFLKAGGKDSVVDCECPEPGAHAGRFCGCACKSAAVNVQRTIDEGADPRTGVAVVEVDRAGVTAGRDQAVELPAGDIHRGRAIGGGRVIGRSPGAAVEDSAADVQGGGILRDHFHVVGCGWQIDCGVTG